MTRTQKILATAAAFAALTVAAGGSAFTAANTGSATSKLGSGTSTVSGAAVSGILYNLDAAKVNVDSVDFTITALGSAQVADVTLDGGAAWFACDAVTAIATTIHCIITVPKDIATVTATQLVVH